MHLTQEQLTHVLGYQLEHGPGRPGFIRVNLDAITQFGITVHQDGPDVLITGFEDGCRVTDRFPLLDPRLAGS